VIHQLRIYEIFDDNKQAFHDRFEEHAIRIMESYGFHFLSLWESKSGDRTEFVYLLEWPDEETMARAWDRFMADQEWKDIKKVTGAEHGRLVGEIHEKVLRPTSYSTSRSPSR
jgi:heme-degrading monooxygenase HmoA